MVAHVAEALHDHPLAVEAAGQPGLGHVVLVPEELAQRELHAAPRRLALAFTPLLASCTLAVTVLMTLLLAPRPGQQGLEVPVVSLLVLTFLGIHALHLRLIARSLRK